MLGPVSITGPCHNNQPPKIVIKGTLMAPPNLSAFPDTNWIVFQDLHGINISGGNGEVPNIDAQGEVEAWKRNSCSTSEKCNKLITVSSTFLHYITEFRNFKSALLIH